jgi:predicted AlkP superfamily pyrophosphatase or phosphodiesterase
LKATVASVLTNLKRDPKNYIASIVGSEQIAKMGGNPHATFYVNFESNAYAGSFKGGDAPLVSASPGKGMHGYFPANPRMRSSFMVMGPGIVKGRDLGEIDIRSIAPTLAKAMDVPFPAAELGPLP